MSTAEAEADLGEKSENAETTIRWPIGG